LKIADFSLPDLLFAPALGVIPFEFHKDLWLHNSRFLGYCVTLFAWSYV